RSPGRRGEVVVPGDHVAPPRLLDVALQLDSERAVVPEAVEPPVDFARLKEEPAPLAQRDQLVHVHDRIRPRSVDYFCQYVLLIPTAPTSTRTGSRRSSGTRANWSTAAAARMSSSYPRARRLAPPLLISSAPSSTRPWCSKQSQASRALSLRR